MTFTSWRTLLGQLPVINRFMAPEEKLRTNCLWSREDMRNKWLANSGIS